MDSAIAKAGRAGLRVILSFANMWKPTDGKKQYVAWVSSLILSTPHLGAPRGYLFSGAMAASQMHHPGTRFT